MRVFVLGITAAMLAVVGASVATASPSVATAPPSVAAACGPSAPDRDSGYTAAINPVPGYSGPAMRTGPDKDCGYLTRIPWGTVVPMNCYRVGDEPINGIYTWTAVHYNGYFGWVSDYHLSNYGSNYLC